MEKSGKKEINFAPDLKYVSPLATAYGKIDAEYAKKKGIIVANVPGYATESVAELVFALILENIREIVKAIKVGNKGEALRARNFLSLSLVWLKVITPLTGEEPIFLNPFLNL